MYQQKRPKWVSMLGLFLVGALVVGAVLVAGDPFDDSAALASEQVERSGTSAPGMDGGDDDTLGILAAAPVSSAAQRVFKIAQAETNESADETAAEPPEQPPADPVAAGEAEAQEEAVDELKAEEAAAEEEDKCCKKGDKTPPFELIAKTPAGELHNPYDWKALKEEHSDDPDYLVKQFRLPGCNECHGGGGGGGFCPALSQGVWFWGNTDDVLFRLIALGSTELQKQGWTRYQYGTIKAPMPEMGHVIKTSDHLWKIIAFIRSINPPGTNPPEKVIPGRYKAPVEERQAE